MNDQIWNDFLKIVREEVGSRVVETWIKAVTFSRYDDHAQKVYLSVPNTFVKNWVQSNYKELFETHLKRLLNIDTVSIVFCLGVHDPQVELVNDTSSRIVPAVTTSAKAKVKKYQLGKKLPGYKWNSSRLNSGYNFDTFVVGDNNSFAYASARAAVSKLGRLYNPLLLYGGSGLGKTHLLHAIGNEVLELYPSSVVLYQTADRFITEFINAIRFNQVEKFQEKYRKIDVLLIDDIQFMVNKEQTQEAFFHIFNSLYDSNKQIVLSSDTLPRHLGGLADRLRSRLEWGLVADIQMPLLETKIAILKRKAINQKETLSDDVAAFIASQKMSNIRELEGTLIRVVAYASLTGKPLTLELAKKVLGHVKIKEVSSVVTFNRVTELTKKYFAYDLTILRSKDRSKGISLARQTAMYLMKKYTKKSLKEIGEFLERKDHTTITHAVQRISSLRLSDRDLHDLIAKIELELV